MRADLSEVASVAGVRGEPVVFQDPLHRAVREAALAAAVPESPRAVDDLLL